MSNIKTVILAAGKGTRMGGDKPKALIEARGLPLLRHVLNAAKSAGFESPVIVVGHKEDEVRAAAGEGYPFARQDRQLGTGHALRSAKPHLADATHVLVLYTDHPLLTADTIKRIATAHESGRAPLTMGTVTVPHFEDWYGGFHGFGRIIRGADGRIAAIREKKDSTPEGLLIREVNPSYFCFEVNWLWHHLDEIGNDNAQKEYYLTDLVGIAARNGDSIQDIAVEPREAVGVNTPAELAFVETMMSQVN